MASTFGEFCFNFVFEERKKPFLLYRFLNLAGQDWSIIYRFNTNLSIFVVNHFSSAAFLYFVLKIPALPPTLSIICCSNLNFQSLVRLSPTPPQLIAFLELPPRCVKIPNAINPLNFYLASLEVGESCHGAVIGFKRDPALGVGDNLARQPRDMITQGGFLHWNYFAPLFCILLTLHFSSNTCNLLWGPLDQLQHPYTLYKYN